MLETTNPQGDGRTDATVVQAMERALREIDSGALGDDPLSRAALFGTIADVMRGHGRMEEATEAAGREVRLRQQAAGDGRTTEKPSFRAVANQRIASSLRHQRRYEAAEAAYERTIAVSKEEDGDAPMLLMGNTLHNFGLMQFERGEYAKALPPLLESLSEAVGGAGR